MLNCNEYDRWCERHHAVQYVWSVEYELRAVLAGVRQTRQVLHHVGTSGSCVKV